MGNGRNGKQCRERWLNQLNPAIRKGPWTAEEDRIILENIATIGPAWTKISKLLPPGRTDNAVKNRYNSTLKVGKAAVSGSRKRARVEADKQPVVEPQQAKQAQEDAAKPQQATAIHLV